MIFFTHSNRWFIPLPAGKHTASATVHEQVCACGFEGVQVVGNDLFAVCAAVRLTANAPCVWEASTSSR